MSDGALLLLTAIGNALPAVEGGWHSTPLPGGKYPYGTFYIPHSLRQAGNVWRHSGIVNIWCRQDATQPNNRAVRDAFALSQAALEVLDGGGFATPGLTLHDFLANEPRREQQDDGTWRGFFTFTATTS